MACESSPSVDGSTAQTVALHRPELRPGGVADDLEVPLAKGSGGALGIHEAAADHDELGIERQHQVGDVVAHGAGLEIEQLDGQRVACLRQPAQRERLLVGSVARIGERVIRQRRQALLQQIGQARERRVELGATPRPTAAAGVGLGAERCSGAAICAVSIPASVSPTSGRPRASMNAEPRPEPGASIRTPPVPEPRTRWASPTPPKAPSLPTTSGTARPACLASACAVVGVEVPPLEGRRHVGGVAEHAIAQVRARDSQADAAHLIPGECILIQVPPTAWTQPATTVAVPASELVGCW